MSQQEVRALRDYLAPPCTNRRKPAGMRVAASRKKRCQVKPPKPGASKISQSTLDLLTYENKQFAAQTRRLNQELAATNHQLEQLRRHINTQLPQLAAWRAHFHGRVQNLEDRTIDHTSRLLPLEQSVAKLENTVAVLDEAVEDVETQLDESGVQFDNRFTLLEDVVFANQEQNQEDNHDEEYQQQENHPAIKIKIEEPDSE